MGTPPRGRASTMTSSPAATALRRCARILPASARLRNRAFIFFLCAPRLSESLKCRGLLIYGLLHIGCHEELASPKSLNLHWPEVGPLGNRWVTCGTWRRLNSFRTTPKKTDDDPAHPCRYQHQE